MHFEEFVVTKFMLHGKSYGSLITMRYTKYYKTDDNGEWVEIDYDEYNKAQHIGISPNAGSQEYDAVMNRREEKWVKIISD